MVIDPVTERMKGMKNQKNSAAVIKLDQKDGISFFHVKSDKFKTVRIDIFILDPLNKERAAETHSSPMF